MKERVFTLMWGTAWERYGQEFIKTFRKHWPDGVELMVIADRSLPVDWIKQVRLGDVRGYQQFMSAYRHDRRAHGYDRTDRKADPASRFWKHDAIKWAPQGMAARAGMDGMEDGDLLAWFDADVATTAAVPKHWLNVLLDGKDMACILRDKQAPEIGFWAVRVGSKTREMVARFATLYESGRVFNLPEWHSAYVFGEAMRRTDGLSVANLNPAMIRGHPWPATALGQYTRHNKGKLKDR